MEEQRMKWDAEAAFKSLNAQGKRRQASIDDERLKTAPYTPPPNVAAWLRAQADKPKGRDYEAILRAAKKAPVGYYEDAPRGIKFGDNPIVIPDNYPCECRQRDDGTWVHLDESCKVHGLAPTPTQSAIGGQPLPSASTKPHGKDVDTADGPWPKCVNWFGVAVYVFAGPAKNQGLYHRDDGTTDRAAGDYADRLRNGGVSMPNPEASQWLEQNGHADVAAQLRGKAINSLLIPTKLIGEEFEPVGTMPVVGDTVKLVRRGSGEYAPSPDHSGVVKAIVFGTFYQTGAEARDSFGRDCLMGRNPALDFYRILKRPVADNAIPRDDVATGGGRVWRNAYGVVRTEVGGNHFLKTLAWGVSPYAPDAYHLEVNEYTELLGRERDAILSECRKAMGL